MTAIATASAFVRRPVHEVAKYATDPHFTLPLIEGFGRFNFLRDLPTPGHQEWDVFLTVGTLQFGGGVDVDLTRERHLIWRSLRGTRHTFDLSVEPVNEGTLLTMEMSITIRGLAMAWMAERISRSILQRHIEAGVHELRHHLEWELD